MTSFDFILPTLITFPCNGKIPSVKKWSELKNPVIYDKKIQNYGILCGNINNVTVIDCDTLKTTDNPNKFICGVFAWNQLKEQITELSDIQIPTVRTPSGGLHLYFKYDSALLSGIQRLDGNIIGIPRKKIKIDILSDKKFVVGPGSRGYEWTDESNKYCLPTIPKTLIDFFTTLQSPKRAVNNIINNLQKKKIKTFIPKDSLYSIVEDLPLNLADNYQDWIKIIWGIAETARQNGYDALDIADTFSKRSHKYKNLEDVQKIYRQNNGSVTYGSLVRFATNSER